MRQLSPAGQQAVNDIAQRQGFSTNAVESMLESVINGNGSMAQFSHPEFGGGGQWMSGGMTMVGDMFNGYLKSRVDNLCSELARLISSQPDLLRSGSFQSQSQNGSTQYNGSNDSNRYSSGNDNSHNLFTPAPPDWWGPDLRFPNSTGGQNDMRYAYFAQARRLAIDVGGQVTVYDTLDHSIGGVSQQSGGYGPQFSSQYGYLNLSQLPVVSTNGVAPMAPAPTPAPASMAAPSFDSNNTGSGTAGDVFASIEKMAALQAKGILTPQEFAAKKAELLSRL